jgi:chaperonin cofactor prefoldin
MLPTNYRVDTQTGAVIFKKSAGRRKAQQMEKDVSELLKRVERLEKTNKILVELLKEKGVITDECNKF